MEDMNNNKRCPTGHKNEKHREDNARCFRFSLKVFLCVTAVAPTLELFLMETNLEKNSHIAVSHHKKRYNKARDSYQENITLVLGEGHLTHGVKRGVGVFVPS